MRPTLWRRRLAPKPLTGPPPALTNNHQPTTISPSTNNQQPTTILTRRRLLVVTAVVLLVAGWLGRDWLLPPAARWLDVGQRPRPVTAVLPLPGDENTRPFVAAAWLNSGMASFLLINQNAASPDIQDGIDPPTQEVIRKVAQVRGVDAERIVMLDGDSTSTAHDLGQLAGYMSEHPEATVAVVTSGFHTRRTRWTIRRQMPEFADRVLMVSAPNPGFETDRWWWTETGRRLIVSEYLKLGYYQLRYNRGAVLVMGAIAVVLVVWVWRARSERREARGESGRVDRK